MDGARRLIHVNQSFTRQGKLRSFGSVLALMLATLAALPHAASADESVQLGAYDVPTVFYIAKSENGVQVHYGLRLDAACRPVGKNPVFAYWSRPRRTHREAARLDGIARRLYGANEHQKVQAGSTGGHVQMYVRTLDKVVVDIDVSKTASGCVAVPTTKISGERAKLQSAYLKIGRLGLSVDYVDVIGNRLANGTRVVQRYRS